MSDQPVKIDWENTAAALKRFMVGVNRSPALLKEIAAGMFVSIRRTFREQGSPAGSWAPLSPRTIANKNSKASGGRKILILSGRLLNSIESKPTPTGIVIGTSLVYARVQQLGSGDGAATVPAHSRPFLRAIHYSTREVVSGGKNHHVPVAMTMGMREIADSRGRNTKVRTKFQGPQLKQDVSVGEHERHQNIPARPYLVVRPEDPTRIRGQVIAFIGRQAAQAGLQTGAAS